MADTSLTTASKKPENAVVESTNACPSGILTYQEYVVNVDSNEL
jgi:hypothetical protein